MIVFMLRGRMDSMTQGGFPAIAPARKSGEEQFRDGGDVLPFNVQDFWAWLASHLMDNTTRGILAEYLVARALGVSKGLRIEWEPFDLITPEGVKVEVKSSAYLQSWEQKKLTSVVFSAPPTLPWEATIRQRQADVYVFALLAHRDKVTVDPLNLAQWTFLVVPTAILDRELAERKTVSLLQVQRIAAGETAFAGLRGGVEAAAALHRQLRAATAETSPTA